MGSPSELGRVVLPRPIRSVGVSRGHTAFYFDSFVVPHWALIDVIRSAEHQTLRNSGWRLDIPASAKGLPSHDVHPALDVAYALLLRGAITTIGHRVLDALNGPNPSKSTDRRGAQSILRELLNCHTDWIFSDEDVFDSDEEAVLAKELRSKLLAKNPRVSCFFQVQLDCLTEADEFMGGGRRVDFVLTDGDAIRLVVEVDGAQHRSEADYDAQRDRALSDSNWKVIRIAASEIRADVERAVGRILDSIPRDSIAETPSGDQIGKKLQVLHRFQVAVVVALRSGLTGNLDTRIFCPKWNDETCAIETSDWTSALDDVKDLLDDLAQSRGEPPFDLKLEVDSNRGFVIHFGSTTTVDRQAAYVHGVRNIDAPLLELGRASSPACTTPPCAAALARLLRRCFTFLNFRDGQLETITRIIEGKDTLLLLPTGAGKSATYQLASMIRGGVGLVIDPLLSLIDDQVQNLKERGIDRCVAIKGDLGPETRHGLQRILAQGHGFFVFVSPERLQSEEFRRTLRHTSESRGISIIAIDEAHCVSQWGHDFRPAYLNVARVARDLCSSNDHTPTPLLAMTGTASFAVLRDIQREIGIQSSEAQVSPPSFDRPELEFKVHRCRTSEKRTALEKILLGLPRSFERATAQQLFADDERPFCGLIFCTHAQNTLHSTSEIASIVRHIYPAVPTDTFASKEPKGVSKDVLRRRISETTRQFRTGSTRILACTNAFGMGIDHPNIRFTIHWGLPQSIEAFYQEAGRAGRSRDASICHLIVSDDDPGRSSRQLSGEEVAEIKRNEDSDIDRLVFFHRNSFPSLEKERSVLLATLKLLKGVTANGPIPIDWNALKGVEGGREQIERAIYRLMLCGYIHDYTVDWRQSRFVVHLAPKDPKHVLDSIIKYVRAFNIRMSQSERETLGSKLATGIDYDAFVEYTANRLIEFTYTHIEGTRRRGMAEMLRIAKDSRDSSEFRKGILGYLTTSTFTSQLQALVDDATCDVGVTKTLFEQVASPSDASDLANQTGRLLASYFNHPSLLVVHAVALLACNPDDVDRAVTDIELALEHVTAFGITDERLLAAFADCLVALESNEPRDTRVFGRLIERAPRPNADLRRARILSTLAHPVAKSIGLSRVVKETLDQIDEYIKGVTHDG